MTFIESIKKEKYNLQQFIWNNRWHILITTSLLICVYGTWFYNMNPRIDAEVFINTPYSTYNYLDTGRYGNVLTEIVFGMRWFDPFFVTCSGFLMFVLAGVLFGFLCWRVGVKSNISTWFGLICFTSPIMVEMIYFDMLIFKAAWAYVLCMFATALVLDAAKRCSKLECLLAIFFLVWIISIYEVFVAVYIALVVFCFIMLYNKWNMTSKENSDFNRKVCNRIILLSIVVLVIALFVNTVISNMFFSSDIGYVYGSFQWSQKPVKDCLAIIGSNIADGICGFGVFYSVFYGITALLVILNIIMQIKNNGKLCWLYVFAGIGLQLCPFLLTIFLAMVPAYRAQLAYPIVISLNILFLLSLKGKNNYVRCIYLVIMVATIWSQAQTTMRLEYTDMIRTQEDMRVVEQIEYRIGTITTKNKPIAIVGVYNNKLNNACLRGQEIGVSIFSHDAPAPPVYFHSSNRACNVAKTWGFDFESVASPEDMVKARQIALDMPSWPAEGSVYDAGEFVIVKLSEDGYVGDIVEPGIKKLYNTYGIQNNDKLDVAIDKVDIVDETMEISGWMIKENEDTSNAKKHVVLYDDNDNYYEISTYRTVRTDVVEYYNNELYNFAGYVGKVYIEQLPKNYKNLKIAMKYQLGNDDAVYYKSDYDIASLLSE